VGWEKGGRYYTRSRKVNGRVVREYSGKGVIGEAAAQLDADRRALRAEQVAARRQERAAQEALAAQVEELDQLADLLARVALVAAGYHRPKRDIWRRKRVCDRQAG
jgi:hypothetical protein